MPKISQIIETLQNIYQREGDLEVFNHLEVGEYDYLAPIRIIRVSRIDYDEEKKSPEQVVIIIPRPLAKETFLEIADWDIRGEFFDEKEKLPSHPRLTDVESVQNKLCKFCGRGPNPHSSSAFSVVAQRATYLSHPECEKRFNPSLSKKGKKAPALKKKPQG